MTILKDISIIWSFLHILVLFLFLFESRYSKRKTILITAVSMIPLIAVNFVLFFILGMEKYGSLMLLTLSLPSCIFFWFLAKHRDGRFFFTFCLVDTIVLELISITNIVNHYTTPDTYLVMFISRLIIYPLLEIWTYKKLRPIYLEVQHYTQKGWGLFAIIGALFYVTITLMIAHPTAVTERPEYIPGLLMLFVLMPIIYLHIITTMRHLRTMYQMNEQKHILSLQVSNLTTRMNELAVADQKFRVERHNFRHKMKTIASLLDTNQYDECRTLLEEYNEAIREPQVTRYCTNPVIDAVLATYIRRAENKGIPVKFGFAFPDQIPVNENELATAIANALENAINACEKVSESKRYIDIKVLDRPGFIIQIANSYVGSIEFDENEIPVNRDEDHGFGTRFIAAFCNKYEGFYQFKADGEKFTLYMNF
ncbi:MAG: GHKL domain-containing protein [Clostridia bacterium]|nr:GHKL domain-containing protein [Clostridia bacterium]